MVLWSHSALFRGGGVDLMSGISYLLDLVDLPCGGGRFINQESALFG